MLTIGIETGNEAFAEGNEAAELARILRAAAWMIDNGYTEFKLHDYNGNRVGWCEYEPDKKEE